MFKNFLPLFGMLLLAVTCCNKATAQYFYKDIWNPQQLIKEMTILKNEKANN